MFTNLEWESLIPKIFLGNNLFVEGELLEIIFSVTAGTFVQLVQCLNTQRQFGDMKNYYSDIVDPHRRRERE